MFVIHCATFPEQYVVKNSLKIKSNMYVRNDSWLVISHYKI